MRKARNRRAIALPAALIGMAIGLVLTATQAHAYYGGHRYGGYSYGGYSYGHNYGRSYGHYGYRPSYYGRRHYGGYYGRSYGYCRPHYYGRHRGGYYGGYTGGLAYGLLSIPRAVVGTIFGHNDGRSHQGGAYDGGTTTPPAITSTVPGRTYGTGTGSQGTGSHNTGSNYTGGWARLAEGRYSHALSIFTAEASSRPRDGGPKVGYAMSAAGTGDLQRGVWAMRRALRIDPDSMHYVTVDGSLRQQVEHLVTQYRHNPGNRLDDAEAAFMLASLHYLLGDAASARASYDVAVASGDKSLSTTNLERLIDSKLISDK